MNLDAFPQFWQTYPRKVGKKEALKAWSKLTPEQRLKAMEALPTHVKYWKACRTEKEFIPHAATWLNGWRFDDELEMPEQKPKGELVTKDNAVRIGASKGIHPKAGEDMYTFMERVRAA